MELLVHILFSGIYWLKSYYFHLFSGIYLSSTSNSWLSLIYKHLLVNIISIQFAGHIFPSNFIHIYKHFLVQPMVHTRIQITFVLIVIFSRYWSKSIIRFFAGGKEIYFFLQKQEINFQAQYTALILKISVHILFSGTI